jgi:hypothetical protein
VGEHLVARGEGRHVLAERCDDAGRLDAERQRRSAAHVPAADPDDLIPVANPGCMHRDHDFIRCRRRRRRELEHAHIAAERLDAGRPHPLHSHHPSVP